MKSEGLTKGREGRFRTAGEVGWRASRYSLAAPAPDSENAASRARTDHGNSNA